MQWIEFAANIDISCSQAMNNEISDYTIVVIGFPKQFHRIRRLVHFISLEQGIDEREADVIERAVAEACHNALFHDPENSEHPSFELTLRLNDSAITAEVRNRGKSFNFDAVEPFSIEHDFMHYKQGGLGIPIMKRLMDEVRYERKDDNLNVVTLVKYINANPKEGVVENNEY